MILPVAALLALATPLPAGAQGHGDAALTLMIQGAYSRYLGADFTPRANFPLTERFKVVEAECAALYKRIRGGPSRGVCGDAYDLFCQCRDYWGTDWSRIVIALSHPNAARAEAIVTFPKSAGPAVRLIFVRGEREWLLDDVWEYALNKGSYRARLAAKLQHMRLIRGRR